MDDYYSLLGIDADASVDDIRGAYRERKDGLDTASDTGKADAARLNKAWNVLSDPYQRGRYDERRAEAAENGDLGTDADAPALNGSTAVTTTARNGASGKSRQQSVREERAAKLKAAATITPPAGTHWPATKQRILAMVVDLLVLVVLVSASQILAQSFAKSQKPEVVHQINSINDQITKANSDKNAADKLVSDDKKANNTSKQATDQKTSDDLKNKVKELEKQRTDAESKIQVYFIAAIALSFFLGFLYLAIPTALTGRTLGKRIQHLKVLREDGSPLGWQGAITRFGLIVLVTFVLYYLLQQLAAVIVLFGVTMWMRNPNMQGLHDRFAHTIVVSDAKT